MLRDITEGVRFIIICAIGAMWITGLGNHFNFWPKPKDNVFSTPVSVYIPWQLDFNHKSDPAIINKTPPPVVKSTLEKAVGLWSKALGQKLRTPELRMVNSSWCTGVQSTNVLACVDSDGKSLIGIPENASLEKYSKQEILSVMLHEEGHILGVPHIALDPLMNSGLEDGGGATFPTPYAVAVAKIALSRHLSIYHPPLN